MWSRRRGGLEGRGGGREGEGGVGGRGSDRAASPRSDAGASRAVVTFAT